MLCCGLWAVYQSWPWFGSAGSANHHFLTASFRCISCLWSTISKSDKWSGLVLLSQHFQQNSKAGRCGYFVLRFFPQPSMVWNRWTNCRSDSALRFCFCCSAQNRSIRSNRSGRLGGCCKLSHVWHYLIDLASWSTDEWRGGRGWREGVMEPQASWNSAVTLTWQSDHHYSRCCFSPCHKGVLLKKIPSLCFFFFFFLSMNPFFRALRERSRDPHLLSAGLIPPLALYMDYSLSFFFFPSVIH